MVNQLLPRFRQLQPRLPVPSENFFGRRHQGRAVILLCQDQGIDYVARIQIGDNLPLADHFQVFGGIVVRHGQQLHRRIFSIFRRHVRVKKSEEFFKDLRFEVVVNFPFFLITVQHSRFELGGEMFASRFQNKFVSFDPLSSNVEGVVRIFARVKKLAKFFLGAQFRLVDGGDGGDGRTGATGVTEVTLVTPS